MEGLIRVEAPCKKKNSKYLYQDEEYTSCSFCKSKCEKATKCFDCGKTDSVFYSSRYDLFSCNYCYEKFDRSINNQKEQKP
jgi:hypothetical protein